MNLHDLILSLERNHLGYLPGAIMKVLIMPVKASNVATAELADMPLLTMVAAWSVEVMPLLTCAASKLEEPTVVRRFYFIIRSSELDSPRPITTANLAVSTDIVPCPWASP